MNREKLKGKRLGLLANPASVDRYFRHASNLINDIFPDQLKALFSPQHGFHAEKQDNMAESDHTIDPSLKIPIFSLYSTTRIPTKEMFDLIDTLIIDIQDVGTRVYTFIYTISYCIETAAKYDKDVVILDRPNPIGGVAVEGNILRQEYSSFVGRFPIPMRHGMTVGEIATLFNSEFTKGSITQKDEQRTQQSVSEKSHISEKKCDLTVIPMVGWKRDMLFPDTNLPWIAPSPNLPTPISALVYPGQVIWEGTNISEGRGTTQPFEIFGAPFINSKKILDSLSNQTIKSDISSNPSRSGTKNLHSVVLRPIAFQPTSGKWQEQVCRGFQIHVVEPELFKPYKTSLILIQQIIRHHADQFRWKEPPYEYEYVKMPIDLILGDRELREAVENLEDIDTIEASWQHDLEKFKQMSRKFYLYD
ncbi:MAG: DUF1343 domain-containing protein [Desulfamplus sp.]|nr:DUF1343 domain-containing protein [Desulfamplus sp.]